MAEKAGVGSHYIPHLQKGLCQLITGIGAKFLNFSGLIASFWAKADKRIGKNRRFWR